MAMEQGEPQAIHPFFRRDFAVATNSVHRTPVNGNLLHSSAPTCGSQEALEGHESRGSDSPGIVSSTSSISLTCPSVDTLDHDPNADRRKRRKTDNGGLAETGALPSFGEPFLPDCGGLKGTVSAASNSKTPEPLECNTPDNASRDPGAEGSLQQLPNELEIPIHSDSTPLSDLDTKRKVVKLNPNGKLLSSPIANKFGDAKNKKNIKRGKQDPRQHEGSGKKVVIIRYGDKGSINSTGKLIDDIINGRTRYPSPPCPITPVVTVTSAPKQEQPAKPMHPFFLKKAARKSDTSAPQLQPLGPSTTEREKSEGQACPVPTFTSKSPLSFSHSFTKVPEPVHPIWPPRDIAHVRDIDQDTSLRHEDLQSSLRLDRRKSKMATMRVSDDENVLSTVTSDASDPRTILRTPERLVTSGRVLQNTMIHQLAEQSRKSSPNGPALSENCHPAITKLYSSLLSSMTAFDRGEFDTQTWGQKYAPSCAQQVLCVTKEAFMLRDWLKHLIVSSIDTGKPLKDNDRLNQKADEKRRKRRKKADKLDGFIVSSGDEASEMDEISGSDDELAGDVTVSNKRTVIRSGDLTFNLKSSGERGRMTNAILLSGPSGCGKTASVYAVAKELDFEIFEINTSSRRSAKDIVDRIGDMTQNHLVHGISASKDTSSNQSPFPTPQGDAVEDGKQNKLMGFFKSLPTATPKSGGRGKSKVSAKETDTKRTPNQKQSLILLEEADILFEEDKQFWSGVLTLISQSKRPIIITCNDENLIPLDDISFHAILRYRTPPQSLAVDYLLLLAANEGHILKRRALEKLYASTGNDLRRSIMELNFWCQIAVGSEKSALDWMIDRWPRGADHDEDGNPLRVLSIDTYQEYMGWFSRDALVSRGLDNEIEVQRESLDWWQISLQDSESMEDPQPHSWSKPSPDPSKLELLDSLRCQADFTEMRSVLDVLSAGCSPDVKMDTIDTSIPPMPEKQRPNYIEGYQVLNATHKPDYTELSVEIGCAYKIILGSVFPHEYELDAEVKQAEKLLMATFKAKPDNSQRAELVGALMPIVKADSAFSQTSGRAEPICEHGFQCIAEDIIPYVRAIITFDLRLEQYRLELSGLPPGNAKGTKRIRTTRASRAALEGGSKAETRKERWFSPHVNPSQILATGKKEWQDLLVQEGHFNVPPVGSQRTWEESEPVTEGSTEE